MTTKQTQYIQKLINADVNVSIPGSACEMFLFKNTETNFTVFIEAIYDFDHQAWKRTKKRPFLFTVTYNDYGFHDEFENFKTLYEDIQKNLNELITTK